jgi:4a-hydroxytetrahydrobiopterin dehydratase
MPLTPNQRSRFQADHPAWTLDGQVAARSFEFGDFGEALGFVTRVALAAERADHHPDIDIRWNRVTLLLTTHSVGAFSERDVALIDIIDGWE